MMTLPMRKTDPSPGPMGVLHRGPCAEDVSSVAVSNIFPATRNRDSASTRGGQKAREMRSAFDDAAAVVADAVDRAGVVVRHQQRAVPEHLHVHRAADIIFVLQEAGHERLPGFQQAIDI